MRWIRSAAWDGCWIWSGLPIGLLLVFVAWEIGPVTVHLSHGLLEENVVDRVMDGAKQAFDLGGCAGVLYCVFALGIILEFGHLMSSITLAWSNRGFRGVMQEHPLQYMVMPSLVLAICLGIGVITSLGLTSYQPGPHQIFHVTDWRNPMPILVSIFWLSVGWHFGMQNFGILRLYRRRRGSEGWRKTDMAICLGGTIFMMNIFPVLSAPAAIGLAIPPLIPAPWWVFPLATGVISWNHWIVAIGVGSVASRRAWLFISGMLLVGLCGFVWKHPTSAQVVMLTSPLPLCSVLGIHFIHYFYDRGVFRFSDPQVRATIGRNLFARNMA